MDIIVLAIVVFVFVVIVLAFAVFFNRNFWQGYRNSKFLDEENEDQWKTKM